MDHSETFSGSLPSHLTDSSIGNLSTSGYHSLNNSRNGVQKLDLNFQTRSDPGIELHRSNSSQRLMNSSRSGADSARSFDSESRSNSKDELRQQPVFDEIQTPFKPASLTKSNSGSLEREGSSGHLKLSGKGTNRRAQELKKDLLDVCFSLSKKKNPRVCSYFFRKKVQFVSELAL